MFKAFIAALLFGFSAFAAEQANVTKTETAVSPSSWKANLYAGYKSYNSSGRQYQLDSESERHFKSKNEFFAGFKTAGGYGMFFQAVQVGSVYGDEKSSRNKILPDDPSVSFMHPIYKGESLTLSGTLREYFPVTDRSEDRQLYLQTYYLNASYSMPGTVSISNQLVLRNFSQKYYLPADTRNLIEDYTTVSKMHKDWLRYGVGQHAQVEYHKGTPTGTCVEVYPYADFMLSKTIFAGPRVYFPLQQNDVVYDGPKAVSMDNVYAELFLQATL